jgi:hypothetical protein
MPIPNKIMKDDKTMYYNTLFKMNLTRKVAKKVNYINE